MREALVTALSRYAGQPLTKEVAVAIVNATIPFNPVDITQFPPQACGSLTFQAERLQDILPEMDVLSRAHWQETEFHQHHLKMNLDYDVMVSEENHGSLIQFTARCGDALVGNLRVYLRTSRHTRQKLAMEDTLFLLAEHRRGRNGMRLIEYAERCVAGLGYYEFRATTKLVNSTGRLLEFMKYKPVATEYVKFLKE